MKNAVFILLPLLCCALLTHGQDTPEMIVQKQLEAYNANDIKAFVATYSDSVEVYNFNAQQQMLKGKEALEKDYAAFFKASPKKYAALRGRIVQGNFVIDKEYVSGIEGQQGFEATAIYEVKDGLIVKVWFVW